MKLVNSIPFLGIVCFILLYIYSSLLYPGGSQADINSVGFSWVHNYWCNLMNENGINGQPNPARLYSITAMIILCLSLMIFFIQFAGAYAKSIVWERIIKIAGVLSMGFAILMFTEYHDLMTTLSSIFGMFVVVGIIKEIYTSDLQLYKLSGIACIVILGLNNYIYYTEHYIEVLPLLQKITLALVLLWITGLHSEVLKLKRVGAVD